MWKKGLIALAVATVLVFSASAAQKPNIIYIMADDLGYGDLGCYGQTKIKTPSIDKMAAEGRRYSDHYTGQTVCAPSRCTLLTGLHQGHAYIRGNNEIKPHGQKPIPADTVTVAKLMKQAGYSTACIGKWGLGYADSVGAPWKQGFDLFFGYLCQRAAHSYYPEFLWRNDEQVPYPDNAKNHTVYSHDELTKEALQWVRDKKDGPFFLYLAYTIPHTKFEVPELGEYENTDWPANCKTQAAMISRMDRDVGTLFDLLKELGIDDNTLVIFCSDNGAHGQGGTLDFFKASGPLQGFKRSMYDGGIRTPYIARWPGKVPAGSNSDHISAFWDFLPTACELAGVSSPDNIDGISMVPDLLGKRGQKKHDFLYWEWTGDTKAVRMGKWKAVAKGDEIELYLIGDDLGERNNLAAQNPETVQKIAAIMEAAHTDLPYVIENKKKSGGKKKKKASAPAATADIDAIAKDGWKIVRASSESAASKRFAVHAVDGNLKTWWHSAFKPQVAKPPHELVIDLGKTIKVSGFSYQPRTDNNKAGCIKGFEFFVGANPDNFGQPVANGEFANQKEPQVTKFKPTEGCYIMFRATSTHTKYATIAELDVIE